MIGLFLAKARKFILKHPKLIIFGKFATIYSLFFTICYHRLDNDFGWHLVSGDYIRRSWIPDHDLFTYTAKSFEWINHEWGSDVILSLIHGATGYMGLSIFYAALWTMAFLVSGAKTRFFTLVIAAWAVTPYVGVRPIAWTVLLFALMLKIVQSKKDWQKLLILPLVLFWANLHGGFVVGLALIVYFAIKNRDKFLWYIFPACLLVTFINPYGPSVYEEIARTLFDSSLHRQVTEWGYVNIFSSSIPYVALWAAGFWFFSRHKLHNWLGLGPLLLLSSMSATRNLPLFVIATYNELDRYLEKFSKELPDNTSRKIELAKTILLSLLAISVVGWLVFTNKDIFTPWLNNDHDATPVAAVTYLKTHNCKGNLFADYDLGGYLIWKLPGQPLYIDGRMPSWQDENGKKYLDRYMDILKDSKAREKEFTKYNIKCVLMRRNSATNEIIASLNKIGWRTVVSANGSSLLVAPNH